MGDTAPCRVAYFNIARPGSVECKTHTVEEPLWADGETAELFGGADDSPPEMVPCEPGLWIWEGRVMRGEDADEASNGECGGGLWWVGAARRMNADEALAVAEDRNPLEVPAHDRATVAPTEADEPDQPKCLCSYEWGDEDCPVHPTCGTCEMAGHAAAGACAHCGTPFPKWEAPKRNAYGWRE